jgi:hypothetical protein
MNSQPRGKRTVDSNNIPRVVVHDNRVGDCVDHPDPALPGSMDLFKETRMLEEAAKSDPKKC